MFQYLTKMRKKYFNCNEVSKTFLISFCNILCYVGCDDYIFL